MVLGQARLRNRRQRQERFRVPGVAIMAPWNILASRSKNQMAEAIKAAFGRKELSTPETSAMCYMMSKQGYLSDRDGYWHPT